MAKKKKQIEKAPEISPKMGESEKISVPPTQGTSTVPKTDSTVTKNIVVQHSRWFFIRKFDKFIALLFFVFLILLIPAATKSTSIPDIKVEPTKSPNEVLPTPAPIPVNKTGNLPPELSAEGIVIQDVDSAATMYSKNDDIQYAPASTTKILTALVGLDHYRLDDVLTVPPVSIDGQDMGLVAGETMTFENLLYGLLIQSGNDAAFVIAENYPGGSTAFVAAMNQKAKELSMNSSSFTNPMGYDDPNHKVIPKDLANLSRVAITNGIIKKIISIPEITVPNTLYTKFHHLTNVNQLLGKVPGVAGIKTGWTVVAGENLVTLVERNGHSVIFVLLKSKDRFGESVKLIDWVFGNFEWKPLLPPTQK
jgi:D-alanyl-D-alanine carboxypeptidase